jgi:hypothetical protein
VPLLGIENGGFVGLENIVAYVVDCFLSNMNIDGTTLNADNCAGWSTESSGSTATCGVPLFPDEGYLVYVESGGVSPNCAGNFNFYCVEQ